MQKKSDFLITIGRFIIQKKIILVKGNVKIYRIFLDK